ncbi:hypothetical protein GLYMA_15G259300v4 [Glycine max]|uniref:Uncharacterized protein n=1 Tax=Glycine max TaxID=3847 RepID=A0A0R0G6Q5_SOYBN|nr:hypothetical protein GYH30_043489 [Glycine max]KRH13719.1 hypothetical protein GLYMA_15G259300v4 [Glycine max]
MQYPKVNIQTFTSFPYCIYVLSVVSSEIILLAKLLSFSVHSSKIEAMYCLLGLCSFISVKAASSAVYAPPSSMSFSSLLRFSL